MLIGIEGNMEKDARIGWPPQNDIFGEFVILREPLADVQRLERK